MGKLHLGSAAVAKLVAVHPYAVAAQRRWRAFDDATTMLLCVAGRPLLSAATLVLLRW
jgi:hypothetical protein